MSLLDHPTAQMLLQDAEVTAAALRGCCRRLDRFLSRYLPCFFRHEQRLLAEYHAQDISDTRETDPLYAAEGIVHPGTILRCCNWVLSHNVVLPAWMHVGSSVQNLGVAHVGDTLSARGRVTQNYAHKGHKFVVADVLVLANERVPLARGTHTAIYLPRQLAEAA